MKGWLQDANRLNAKLDNITEKARSYQIDDEWAAEEADTSHDLAEGDPGTTDHGGEQLGGVLEADVVGPGGEHSPEQGHAQTDQKETCCEKERKTKPIVRISFNNTTRG